MQPEAKAKWLEALRSGQFRQTTGTMKRCHPKGPELYAYCCLGVLREVAGTNGIDGGYLDKQEAEQFGLEGDTMTLLARMNDGTCADRLHRGSTFADIADWIEEHL